MSVRSTASSGPSAYGKGQVHWNVEERSAEAGHSREVLPKHPLPIDPVSVKPSSVSDPRDEKADEVEQGGPDETFNRAATFVDLPFGSASIALV